MKFLSSRCKHRALPQSSARRKSNPGRFVMWKRRLSEAEASPSRRPRRFHLCLRLRSGNQSAKLLSCLLFACGLTSSAVWSPRRPISPNPGSKTRLRSFDRCAQLFELSVYVALRLWLVCLRSLATDACPMPTPASAHLKSGGRIPSDARSRPTKSRHPRRGPEPGNSCRFEPTRFPARPA